MTALLSILMLQGLFVSVGDAQRLVDRGALVLDVRPRAAFAEAHIVGAHGVDWEDTRDGRGRTGRLTDDDAVLARKLGALGIDGHRSILVSGAANLGWGEEGRIAWMLRYLGHEDVHILDGGVQAWRAVGNPMTKDEKPHTPTHFAPHRHAELRAELDAARAPSAGTVLLDVRSQREWDGATPYFEARGGHLPHARHLEWTSLLDRTGRVLDAESVAAQLAPLGITKQTPVIVYCTGGVRSAFVWAILTSLGYDARNFDGSFWQWSLDHSLPIEVGGAP